jgi:hypothetical protein
MRASLLFLALLLLPVLASGEERPARTYGLLGTMLDLCENPGIRGDVGITEVQLKALLTLRQKAWDNIDQGTLKDRREIEGELRQILSAEQFKRAEQLAVRLTLGMGLGDPRGVVGLTAERPPTFLFHGVSEGQDEILARVGRSDAGRFGGVSHPVLPSAEERKALLDLMGPPDRGPVPLCLPLLAADPRRERGELFPVVLDYLASAEVRAVLKISRAEWARVEHVPYVPGLRDILGAPRGERLRQVAWQHLAQQVGPPGLGRYVERHLMAAVATQEQRDRLAHLIHEEYLRAVLALATLEKPREVLRREMADLELAIARKAEAILSAEQLAKIQTLLGEPVERPIELRQGFGPEPDPTLLKLLPGAFGRFSLRELACLDRPWFQEELKLDESQRRALDAAVKEGEKLAAEFEKAGPWVEKQLAILTPTQRQRFGELVIQERLLWVTAAIRWPDRVPWYALWPASAFPGVAEKLGVTAEQRKKLLALEPEANVLTEAQRKQLDALAGAPARVNLLGVFNVNPGNPAPRSRAPEGPRLAYLILKSDSNGFPDRSFPLLDIREELRLTPEQIRKVRGAFEQLQGGFSWRSGRSPMGESARQAFAALVKAIDDILTLEQRLRLAQVNWQLLAGESLSTALLADGDLKLTPEQTQRIKALRQQAWELGSLLGEKVRYEPARLVVGQALRDKLDDALLQELTAEQRARWQGWLGPAYAGIRRVPVQVGAAEEAWLP